MNIIPQEVEADSDYLAEELQKLIQLKSNENIRVFLFGSWVSYEKSFTNADVDIFVGVAESDNQSPPIELQNTRIDVVSKDGNVYENRPIELHWGDPHDFISEIPSNQRIELTDRIDI